MSRAALALAVAVVAAVAVLAGGAMRSGPVASSAPSATTASAERASASLPLLRTPASSIATTPEPPEPTEVSGVRGDFVGPLGHVESCPVLYERDGVLEVVLPDGYRSRLRGGRIEILGPAGAVVASEGDLLGLKGRVRDGGSFCMTGPQLHVSKVVDVLRRQGG